MIMKKSRPGIVYLIHEHRFPTGLLTARLTLESGGGTNSHKSKVGRESERANGRATLEANNNQGKNKDVKSNHPRAELSEEVCLRQS
jgi:hypothetical protein